MNDEQIAIRIQHPDHNNQMNIPKRYLNKFGGVTCSTIEDERKQKKKIKKQQVLKRTNENKIKRNPARSNRDIQQQIYLCGTQNKISES